IVTAILSMIGINIVQIKNEIDGHLSCMPQSTISKDDDIYITSRLNKVLEAAQNEAQNMNDEYLSTEHMLLSISADSDPSSPKILERMGVNRDLIHSALLGEEYKVLLSTKQITEFKESCV
ncbi:MAG: Clp protease N-terminal domain-containing protein, partial [Halobacteriota archaeon]|nr:Clp protease N-terminal domain-containing protein [Halobacteriota archaeon]